jgi:hypothetical protein
MKNTLLALLGFSLPSTPLAATAQQFGDFTYTTNNGTITITAYTGPGGAVTIPDNISGLPVTVIGYSAFASHNKASVAIPDSVTTVAVYAFVWCTSLTSVTIPVSVTSLGWGAFMDCTSLTNVTILGSVTSIENSEFFSCTRLTKITMPDSVTNIASDAFESCTSLASVVIPRGVTLNQYETMLFQQPLSLRRRSGAGSSGPQHGASTVRRCPVVDKYL